MKIESTVWLKNDPNSKQKANANVVFDGCFVVKGIRIMQGENGLFVAMPSKKVGNYYKQDFYPITKEFKQELDANVLAAYEEKLAQAQDEQFDVQEAEQGEEQGESAGMSMTM